MSHYGIGFLAWHYYIITNSMEFTHFDPNLCLFHY